MSSVILKDGNNDEQNKVTNVSIRQKDMMSKQHYIDWINRTFYTNYEKVEELYSGVEACKMIHMLWPDAIDITKLVEPLQNQPLSEKQALLNYKLLEKSFSKLKIQVDIRPTVIVKGRLKDNLHMASWMMKFYMENVKNRYELETYESDEFWDSESVENSQLEQPTVDDGKEKLEENIPFEEDIRIPGMERPEEQIEDVIVIEEGEENYNPLQGSDNVFRIPRNSIMQVIEMDWTPEPPVVMEYGGVREEFCQTDVDDVKEISRKDKEPERDVDMKVSVHVQRQYEDKDETSISLDQVAIAEALLRKEPEKSTDSSSDRSDYEDPLEQDDASSISSDGEDDAEALLTVQHAESIDSTSEDESSDSSATNEPVELMITSVRCEDPARVFPLPGENHDIEEANYKQ